jgi:hypothetical protein
VRLHSDISRDQPRAIRRVWWAGRVDAAGSVAADAGEGNAGVRAHLDGAGQRSWRLATSAAKDVSEPERCFVACPARSIHLRAVFRIRHVASAFPSSRMRTLLGECGRHGANPYAPGRPAKATARGAPPGPGTSGNPPAGQAPSIPDTAADGRQLIQPKERMMDHSTRVMRRPRRARPRPARAAAAIIATAVLALPAAACSGGNPSSTGSGGSPHAGGSPSSSTSARLVAFSHCMRSHGVRQFPDPPPGANDIKFPDARMLDVSSSQFQSATDACRHLLPPGVGGWYLRSQIRHVLSAMRRFAQCMRSHGISNWPDPIVDSQGRVGFNADNPPGSRTDHAMNQCRHLLPSDVVGILQVGGPGEP